MSFLRGKAGAEMAQVGGGGRITVQLVRCRFVREHEGGVQMRETR